MGGRGPRFAQLGANLVLACRSAERTAAALAQLRAVTKAGQTVEFIRLDLASFDSVRQFATDFQARHGKLDVLVNNAGIMMCPFELTADGHESQFQSNHLGIAASLLPPSTNRHELRLVSVSMRGGRSFFAHAVDDPPTGSVGRRPRGERGQ